MNQLQRTLLFLLLAATAFAARGGGDEVVVLYNSRMPESKAVAEHYAQLRQVPARQIFGFALTTNEVMTRADFTDFLQRPLAEKLEDAGLWKFGFVTIPATNGHFERLESRVVRSKIRYAVLCYGMPLKIVPALDIEENFAAEPIKEEFRRNEAAVDSELTWLPLLKTKVPLTGPLLNPFYLCTNRTLLNCTNGVLLVARLDGPTPEIASNLVDKALQAENDGLWGRAYVDARSVATNSNYYVGDQWLRGAAEVCSLLGFETTLDTNEATFPAAMPMSHIGVYAGWYAGEACGPFAQPKVEFMPGAIAYHIHSFSADTLRSATRNWCGPLLAKGATCTLGFVHEPYLQLTPNVTFFLQTLGSGGTLGEAAWASQIGLSWQTTVIGDPLYQPFKKSPPELHAQLARTKNPLLEWSFDRLVCLDLVQGLRSPQLIQFLANVPATTQSAVLMEKLAALYTAAGKPSSAIEACQSALQLNPSPQQRLRLRLTLGEKLAAQNRLDEARADYKELLRETPDYSGRTTIEDKIQSLERQINTAPKP